MVEMPMATKPIPALLNRKRSIEEARTLSATISPLLLRLVNYGTQIFDRCCQSGAWTGNQDVAVSLLYLHIIETVDAVAILLRSSSCRPARILLRSTLEALISIEYILQDESDQRALA